MNGPGKYDLDCTHVREMTQAHSVVLIVVDGRYGSGFSVQTGDRDFATRLPALLRHMADDIEAT